MISASSQVVGTLRCVKEKMNRSLRGLENGFENCFRRLLLIPSGPAAFPTEIECKVSPTSCGFPFPDRIFCKKVDFETKISRR